MAAHSPSVTIRMGATHWDVAIKGAGLFNLRSMTREQRGRFHGQFMAAVRKQMRQGR